MKIYLIIALSIFITQSNCFTCTKQPDDTLVLVAETAEFISRNIPELFKSSSEDLTIADQKEVLKIVPTLELKDSLRYQMRKKYSISLEQPTSMQAAKVFKDSLTQQSLNQFFYMEVKTDRISYLTNTILQGSQARTGMKYVFWERLEDVGTLSCFDFDFISTNIQIIDCIITPTVAGTPKDFATLIYTLTADGTERLQLQNFNPQQYKTATSTIMKTSGNYIYRGVPHYALDNEQSAIDIMLYNNTPQEISLITSLNQQVLAQLLNQPTYEVYMVDFRITSGHNIAILNRNGDVIHVQYIENTQKWTLTKQFNTKIDLLAFDYDFYSNRFVGVSVNQIVYAEGPTYTFPTNLVKPKVFFTLSYVIVTTTTQLYHFGNISPIPVSYDMEPYFWIIANQKQNDILYFGEKEIRKYLLNQYSTLRLYGTTVTAEKTTTITQKLGEGGLCVLKIKLSILEKATFQIIPIHDPQYFLPYGIDWAYSAIDHNRVFEGPNLKFTSETNNAVTLEFSTHSQYLFGKIPDQDKITYIKFFQPTIGSFIYIIQTNDLKVIIYDCPLDLTTSICNFRTSFFLTVQMNELNAQFLYYSGLVTLFVLETNQQISAYLLQQMVVQPIIFGAITNGAYVQIKLGYSQLFALNVQTKTITSFRIKNTTTYPLQITIDENFMIERGYKAWTPELLGAGELKNVLAVFDSENKLTLISYKNTPNCYIIAQQDDFRYIGVLMENRILDVMGSKVIAVCKFENLSAYIYVVNFEDEANVYLQRSIFLQRFAFEQKLNYQSSQNIAYLTTKTTQKQNYVVLVLDLQRIALSTIFTTIECDEKTFISSHNNYLMIQTKTTTSVNQIDKDLYILARNNVNSAKYLENVIKPIKVQSDDSEFSYQQTLQIVNTYQSIQMDQNKVKINTLQQLKSRTQDSCYDLGLDFIKGNAVVYKATCTQCVPGNVKIIPPLVQGKKICLGGIDIQNFNEYQFIVLYADKFTLVEKETFAFEDFKFDKGFTGKHMEIIDQGLFIQCSSSVTNQQLLIRYKCITNVCIRSGNSLILPNDVVQYKYIDNYLFVGSASKMQIYYIANLSKFDEVVLVKETQIQLRRFTITKIGVKSYQLYMIQTDEFLNIQVQTLTKDVATFVDSKLFSLFDLVTEAKYYVGKSTIFNGLFNLNQDVEHNPQILFTTSDVAQYVIQFTFTCAQDSCAVMTVTIPFILSQYGYWNTNDNPQVSINKQYIAMSYESLGSRAVIIYRNKAPADKTIPVLSLGGLENPLFAQDNQVLLYELNGETKFIATSGVTNYLNEYTITESLQLCLKGEIYDQIVSINVKNDFGNTILPVNIALIQETDTASKSLWWVWLLVVLVIGGAAFGLYWYKKRKQRKVDNYGQLS